MGGSFWNVVVRSLWLTFVQERDGSIIQSVSQSCCPCLPCVCVCVSSMSPGLVLALNANLFPFTCKLCVCVCVKERERATAKQKDERLMSESARPPVGSVLTEPIVGERQTTGTDGVVVVFVVADVSYWPKAKKKKHLLR